nr:zinc finger, CCHC-type [Tanacetum cinerariifolium]
MGDENPIRTLGDYSKPSHEGYRNTIELPVGNNVVPLRSNTIRIHHHMGDLTTRFLAQFFPPGRTTKLCNDILMFQHHGESLFEAWTRFKDLLQKVPHHGIDLWLQVQIYYDHVNPVTRRTVDQSAADPEQAFVEYAFSRTDEARDPRLSQVVLGKPFVDISNMTHEPPEGVKKEHTKSVYLRNEEDKRTGVEYVMRKILGFYKECLELGPEYATGMDDEGEVT